MKKETFYCLVLSESQARFLATSKYGIDRMKALMSLVERVATAEHKYEQKGFTTTVHIGQVVISEVELSRLWKCDRKTVSRVLDTMNELGIVSTMQNNRTSIHTLLCISAWYVNGQMVVNPYYVPMKNRFPEGNSTPINVPANANDNADDTTKEPTSLGQLPSDVQDGNIPNQQQSVSPHSISQQPSCIYDKVGESTDNNVDGHSASYEVLIGVDGGKEIPSITTPSIFDCESGNDGVGFCPGNGIGSSTHNSNVGQTSMKTLEPTSNGTDLSDDQLPPIPKYHSINDKVIDELNKMPK